MAQCLSGKLTKDVLSGEHDLSGGDKHPRDANLDLNLHSLSRQLIELRMEHADLDATIDRLVEVMPTDELMLRRLKKRRLALRDQVAKLEVALDPQEPA